MTFLIRDDSEEGRREAGLMVTPKSPITLRSQDRRVSYTVLPVTYVLGDGAYPTRYVVFPNDSSRPPMVLWESEWNEFLETGIKKGPNLQGMNSISLADTIHTATELLERAAR